jgi:hypothetical protein
LSDFDVPHDEMPDSLLPIQGPAPQRERDLDALLSGKAGYPTVMLGPVAGVLAALRAAPGPGELDGEAAARAAFRLFLPAEAAAPGAAPGPAPLHQRAAAAQGGPDGQGVTAGLPLTVPGGPRHRRPRRQAPRHGRWQVMAVACGAAAVVIVGVVALAGSFSGGGGQHGRAGQPLSAAPSVTDATSIPPKSQVDGRASTAPTPRTAPSPQPVALCRQYMDFFTHREPAANWAKEAAVVQQLRTLAGGLPQITGYCFRQLGMAGAGSGQGHLGGAGAPGPANQPGRGRFAEPGIPRLSQSRAASHSGGARPFSGGR